MSSPETGIPANDQPASDAASVTRDFTRQDKANFVKALWEGLPTAGDEAAPAPPPVEVLRKIPAPEKPVYRDTPESAQALAFAAMIEAKLEAGGIDVLTPPALQALMAALCKLYAANAEAGQRFPVLADQLAVNGTEAMILCGALLKAVDLQVFELGMWQSWSNV